MTSLLWQSLLFVALVSAIFGVMATRSPVGLLSMLWFPAMAGPWVLLAAGYGALADSRWAEPVLGWAKPWQAAVAFAPWGIAYYARRLSKYRKPLYDRRSGIWSFLVYSYYAAVFGSIGLAWRGCGWLVQRSGVF